LKSTSALPASPEPRPSPPPRALLRQACVRGDRGGRFRNALLPAAGGRSLLAAVRREKINKNTQRNTETLSEMLQFVSVRCLALRLLI